MEDVKETIRQFILTIALKGESPSTLRDDTPLQTSGILDSLALLSLITFLEKKFGMELSASEAGVEEFDRITDMVALIERKRTQ
jgi:acyl carrier protein